MFLSCYATSFSMRLDLVISSSVFCSRSCISSSSIFKFLTMVPVRSATDPLLACYTIEDGPANDWEWKTEEPLAFGPANSGSMSTKA